MYPHIFSSVVPVTHPGSTIYLTRLRNSLVLVRIYQSSIFFHLRITPHVRTSAKVFPLCLLSSSPNSFLFQMNCIAVHQSILDHARMRLNSTGLVMSKSHVFLFAINSLPDPIVNSSYDKPDQAYALFDHSRTHQTIRVYVWIQVPSRSRSLIGQ